MKSETLKVCFPVSKSQSAKPLTASKFHFSKAQ
nr:MAG TPA: hypothetical protein [Caudoviricetes sp.]